MTRIPSLFVLFAFLFLSLSAESSTSSYALKSDALNACKEVVSEDFQSGDTNYQCIHQEQYKRFNIQNQYQSTNKYFEYEKTGCPSAGTSHSTDIMGTTPDDPDGNLEVIVGGGSGTYNSDGCAVECGTQSQPPGCEMYMENGDLVVSDSCKTANELEYCEYTGNEFQNDSDDDGYIAPEDGSECVYENDQGECMDLDQQPDGTCPDGMMAGEYNGTQVCVTTGGKDDNGGDGSGDGGSSGDGSDDGSDGGSDSGAGSGGDDGSGTGGDSGDGSDGGDGSGDDSGTGDDGSGTGGNGNGDGEGEGVGTPGVDAGDFYESKNPDGVEKVISDFNSEIEKTQLMKSIDGFFDVDINGYSCPVWTIPSVMKMPAITIDQQCSSAMNQIWPGIAAIIIATCGFYAFRIAVL